MNTGRPVVMSFICGCRVFLRKVIAAVLRNLAPAEHELLVIQPELLDQVVFFWCAFEVVGYRFPIFGVDVPGDKDRNETVRAVYRSLPQIIEKTCDTVCRAFDKHSRFSGVRNSLEQSIENIGGGRSRPEGQLGGVYMRERLASSHTI